MLLTRRFWEFGAVASPLFLGFVLLLPACEGGKTIEERAEEAAEQIRKSQPDVEATAMAQAIDEEAVNEAQKHLAALKEYQGEINGVLDSITINAIEAFQRTADLTDNGILDQKTQQKLAAAAAGGP